VRVTHPFHPWSGREFVFVAVRQTWAEDRVFFLDAEGRQHSLPVGWTDAAGARSGWRTCSRWRGWRRAASPCPGDRV
jgi:hypothetical protein